LFAIEKSERDSHQNALEQFLLKEREQLVFLDEYQHLLNKKWEKYFEVVQ
jgi:hypothetical protein